MSKNKRKKKVPITDFWEKKLDLDYNTEIEYYRKLCGLKYKIKLLRKDSKYDIESKYLSYQKWKRHILSSVDKLNITELKTYSLFLNQECRNNTVRFTMHQSTLIPYTISILSIVASAIISIFSSINDYNTSNILKILSFLLIIGFYFMSINIFKDLIMSGKEEDVTKNFYYDVKEIIDEKISNKSNGSK